MLSWFVCRGTGLRPRSSDLGFGLVPRFFGPII